MSSTHGEVSVPAGWYPAPGEPQLVRYWDGGAWTEHRNPTSPAPAPPPLPYAPSQLPGHAASDFGPWAVDNTFAWTLAFAPLLLVVLQGVFVSAGIAQASLVATLLAIGANIALATADSLRVRAAGARVSSALAFLLVPVYLFVRQPKVRQSYAIPIVWCVCFVMSLGAAGILANTVGVAIQPDKVEVSIQNGVLQQTGLAVTAACPSSISARVGSTFQCVITAVDGSTRLVDVTVQNSSGDIVWRLA